MKVKLFSTSYRNNNDNYDHDYYELIKGITEWEECTPEEYTLLKEYSNHLVIALIEKPEYELILSDVIAKTKTVKRQMEKNEKNYKAREQERKEKATQRKIERAKKLLQAAGEI